MSTEHQQYSIDNQSEAIKLYAKAHNMEIVRTYSDSGRSGLTIQNRPALKQMIEDVERGSPGYSAILVYDVSRWGRFQDTDESAYYEYRCRRANISVHYCVEAFSNDGSVYAALLKTIKRTMAAEYSRELSAKVFAGKARLTELGFRQGGTVGYGLRRLLVDQSGKPKCTLQSGELKSIATDRVVFIPGPPDEVEVVNEIFRLYVTERRGPLEIATILNKRGIKGEDGRPWTRHIVRRMVTNPKYIGTVVTNRTSQKLHGPQVENPPEMWIRRDNAFPAIVDPALFREAQITADCRAFRTDEDLLDCLRELIQKHGKASLRLLRTNDMPCAQVYAKRFGGLAQAYDRIGFKPRRDLSYVERDRGLTPIRREFIIRVVDTLKTFGASIRQENMRLQYVTVNEKLKMRISIVRCIVRKRTNSWRLQFNTPDDADVTIFARIAPGNQEVLDYFCVPRRKKKQTQITVSGLTPAPSYVQQFNDIGFLRRFAEQGRKLKKRWPR